MNPVAWYRNYIGRKAAESTERARQHCIKAFKHHFNIEDPGQCEAAADVFETGYFYGAIYEIKEGQKLHEWNLLLTFLIGLLLGLSFH